MSDEHGPIVTLHCCRPWPIYPQYPCGTCGYCGQRPRHPDPSKLPPTS